MTNIFSKILKISSSAVFLVALLLFVQNAEAQTSSVKWNNPSIANAPAGIQHQSFFSQSMQTDVGYTVYVPPGYATSNQSYPVIYFLHGINGNEWNYHSSTSGNQNALPALIESGQVAPAIVIFVNGGKGLNYINASGSCASTKACPETMIITELIPDVDARFRTIASREGRAIQGFSMGGIGASYYGVKYPQLFSSVAAFSSACYLIDTCADVQNSIVSLVPGVSSPKPAFKLSYGSETGAITSWQNQMQGLLENMNFVVPELSVLFGVGHDFSEQLSYPVSANVSYGKAVAQFHQQYFGDAPNPTATPQPTSTPPASPVVSPSPVSSPVATPTTVPGISPSPEASTQPNPTRSPRASASPGVRGGGRGSFSNSNMSREELIALVDVDGNRELNAQDFIQMRGIFGSENCEKNIVGSCTIDIYDYNALYEVAVQ